jgi:hypothetical protein
MTICSSYGSSGVAGEHDEKRRQIKHNVQKLAALMCRQALSKLILRNSLKKSVVLVSKDWLAKIRKHMKECSYILNFL